MKTEKEVYKKIVPIATPNHSSLQIFHGVALNERNSSTHSRSSFCIGENIPSDIHTRFNPSFFREIIGRTQKERFCI